MSAIQRKNSRVVVGLDPHLQLMSPPARGCVPEHGEGAEAVAQAIIRFNEAIIKPLPQMWWPSNPKWPLRTARRIGFLALEKTLAMAKEAGLLVIVDGSATTSAQRPLLMRSLSGRRPVGRGCADGESLSGRRRPQALH